ncbi:phosphate ABC transporter permease subunit PstC [Catelliglobosispora koreensis]|uniref:phosphate ABC transporter permease subunit PstC n=1 Tax=Catelliglobosispora koreensis TaxID=129052 RepID=UPI00037B937A|nr:phosphate ABC transporter permease subunit PstC [Catelliglobosispora koreensis]
MTQSRTLTQKDRGRINDRAFWLLCVTAGVAVLGILAAILVSTIQQSWPALSNAGANGFFTSTGWDPNVGKYGILAFMFGTVVVSLIAVLFAVPVSIGIALFLTELAHRRVKAVVVTLIDLLASVPSVVFGLWGLYVFSSWTKPLYEWLHDTLGGIPVIGALFGSVTGLNFMTAGLILAVMIIPIITSITREVFDTVPAADKQAAWALGATKWEMIRGAVLPHSFGGIVGAVMLGLGRAMGETVAVALVIGAAIQVTPNLFAPGYTIPAAIVNLFGESSGEFTAALIGMGVVLFVLTIAINLLAQVVVRRAEIRMKGAVA